MKKLLSVLLVVLMLVGMLPINALHTHAAETTETMNIYGSTGTKTSDSSSISWTSNGVTFTNGKGSTAIRTSDSDHYRLYQNSSVTVSAPGNITKIVVTCTSSSYATVLKNSAGSEAAASGSTVTIVPTASASSYTIGSMTAQARIKTVAVTYAAAAAACEHTNTTTTTVDATCTKPGSTTVTCKDCGEIVSTTEIPQLSHQYELSGTTYTCSNCGDSYETFFISFSVPDGVPAIDDMEYTAGGIQLPTAGVPTGDHTYTFAGWTIGKVDNETTVPTIYKAGETFTATAATTLYAVYTYSVAGEGTGSTEYVLTDIDNIKATDEVVITMTYQSTVYALNSSNGTSSAPAATTVTVSNQKLSAAPNSNLIWNIETTSNGYIIYPNGTTDTWLYCTSTNNGVRVGTNANKVFMIDSSSGYLKNTATNRYLGVYRTTPDWRCYTNTTGNTANQTLGFYVKSSGASSTTYYTTVISSTPAECTHENTTTTTVNATCTENGSVTVTCDDCETVISTETLEATGHTTVVDAGKEPTCVSTGLTEGSHCSVCNAVLVAQETIPATGVHTYENGVCTGCGETVSTTASARYYIAAIRTSGNYFYMTSDLGTASTKRYQAVDSGLTTLPESITEPEDGYVFVLIDNGDGTYSIQAEGVEGNNYLGHTSGNSGTLVAEASALKLTMTDNGDGTYSFSYAASDATRYLALNGTANNNYFAWYKSGQKQDLVLIPVEDPCNHTYGEGVVTAPTCTTAGYTTYTCSLCGKAKTENEVAATGHLNTTTTTVEATCTVAGSVTVTCDTCGAVISSTTIPAGHSWDEGKVTTEATCETDGVKTYTCSVCKETKTEEISAIGHIWDEGEITTAATCDAPGSKLYTCQNDPSHTKTEEIAPLGHSYDSEGICENCGAEVSRFQMVTDYKEILAGGQFVLAIREGETYYALGQLENGTMKFGSDMPGTIVTVNVTETGRWIEWAETVPVWNVDYYTGGQNSFTISSGGKYLAYGGNGTGFGNASDTPYQWVFVNKDAQGNNETDDDYAVIAEDGVVSFYTAAGENPSRSINLYDAANIKFRMYSNNNNFDTVCFFKVVKAAGENCTVKFMENGTETMTQTVETGEIITLPEPTLDTYPEGYTHFVGWVTLPYEETLIAPTDIYYISESAGDQNTTLQVTNDMTLYALYSRTDPDAEGQSMSYHRVTDESQIAVGQYYIIVGYDKANDKWFAMSLDQYNDARGGSWITPDENGVIQIAPNDRVASFHLEQGVSIGSYGFFDVMRNQFLSSAAATEDNNSLRSTATLGESESFTIQINDDGSYSIISLTKDGVDYLVLYNTNDNKNPLFSCYDSLTGLDKTKTYLYVGQTNAVPGTYYATNGHIHDYQITAKVEASCTTAGYTQYTCSICGEIKMEDVVAHGHTLGEATIIEPTCIEAGSSTSFCVNANCPSPEWVEILPALGHDYDGEQGEVVTSSNGYHVVVYPCVRECGAEHEAAQLRFTNASLTLENNIVVNFKTSEKVAGDGTYAGFTDLRAVFTYGERTGNNAVPAEGVALGDGRYNLACRRVTPSQIGDEITAVLYGTYDGVVYSFEMKYSAAEYCYAMLKETTDTKLQTLLVDLLYYCDAAREYTTYQGVDETYKYYGSVTEDLTDVQKKYRTVSDEFTSVMGLSGEGEFAATWQSASLVLGEATSIRFRVDLGGYDISAVTVKATVGGKNYTDISVKQNGETYLIQIDGISAHRMRETVEVTLYSGETVISKTVSYSIESYVANKMGDTNEKLVNMLIAMMSYGDAAVAYKG